MSKTLRILITVVIALVFIAMFLPWLLTSCSWFGLDFSDTGPVGDTIGGIMGPFIASAPASTSVFE